MKFLICKGIYIRYFCILLGIYKELTLKYQHESTRISCVFFELFDHCVTVLLFSCLFTYFTNFRTLGVLKVSHVIGIDSGGVPHWASRAPCLHLPDLVFSPGQRMLREYHILLS